MNKTININLAGIIFHLDEGAYESFNDYLNQVKNALDSQEGGAEIIADSLNRPRGASKLMHLLLYAGRYKILAGNNACISPTFPSLPIFMIKASP